MTGQESLGGEWQAVRKDPPKGRTQTKDRAGLVLAFQSRGGSSIWFLMASKLPPQVLELPGTTSRCWLVGVGAVCLGGGAAGRALLVPSQVGWVAAMRGMGKAPNRWFLIIIITFY